MIAGLCFSALAGAAAMSPMDLTAATNKVSLVTKEANNVAAEMERKELGQQTRERLGQWGNFIADIESRIPELLQDSGSTEHYERLDFPSFISAAPAATSTVWNPFQPWLVQLSAYKTYMTTYISYQQTWVHKLKCTFTGDCSVSSTVAYSPLGATKIVMSSAAGFEKGSQITIASALPMTGSFLEAAACSHIYSVTEVDGDVLTISPATCAEYTKASVTANGVSASPSPAAGGSFKIASCSKMDPAGTGTDMKKRAAVGDVAATDALIMEFAGTGVVKPLQEVHITIDLGEAAASTPQTWTVPTMTIATATTVAGTGAMPCIATSGSDGACKTAAGTAMAATDIAPNPATSFAPEGTVASTVDKKFQNMAGTDGNVKVGNGGAMYKFKFVQGLQAIAAGGQWFVGGLSAQTAAASKPYTITMEFTKGASAEPGFVGKATCTTGF